MTLSALPTRDPRMEFSSRAYARSTMYWMGMVANMNHPIHRTTIVRTVLPASP
eukprot:ANDGO_01639.mRNA.1 hypothetical protein